MEVPGLKLTDNFWPSFAYSDDASVSEKLLSDRQFRLIIFEQDATLISARILQQPSISNRLSPRYPWYHEESFAQIHWLDSCRFVKVGKLGPSESDQGEHIPITVWRNLAALSFTGGRLWYDQQGNRPIWGRWEHLWGSEHYQLNRSSSSTSDLPRK